MKFLVLIKTLNQLENLSNLVEYIQAIGVTKIELDLLHNPKLYDEKGTREVVKEIEIINEAEKELIRNKFSSLKEYFNLSFDTTEVSLNVSLEIGDFEENFNSFIDNNIYDFVMVLPDRLTNLRFVPKNRNINFILDKINKPLIVIPRLFLDNNIQIQNFVCLVDNLKTYNLLLGGNTLRNIKKDKIEYIHFGIKSPHENVSLVQSKNISQSLTNYVSKHTNTMFILHHKHESLFSKFFAKSVTKTLLAKANSMFLIV